MRPLALVLLLLLLLAAVNQQPALSQRFNNVGAALKMWAHHLKNNAQPLFFKCQPSVMSISKRNAHWHSIGPTLSVSPQQWTAKQGQWSSQSIKSTQQDCLMMLLVLIRDFKKIRSLYFKDTLKKASKHEI